MSPPRILLRIAGRNGQRSALFLGCVLFALLAVQADEKPAEPVPLTPREPAGVLIQLDANGKIEVREATAEEVEKSPPQKGLFIWPEGEQAERWRAVGPGWKRPQRLDLAAPVLVADNTRGGAASPAGVEVTQLTTPARTDQPGHRRLPRRHAAHPGGRRQVALPPAVSPPPAHRETDWERGRFASIEWPRLFPEDKDRHRLRRQGREQGGDDGPLRRGPGTHRLRRCARASEGGRRRTAARSLLSAGWASLSSWTRKSATRCSSRPTNWPTSSAAARIRSTCNSPSNDCCKTAQTT